MGNGRGRRTALVGAACVVLGAAAGPSMATGAGAIKDVIVKNTIAEPVPTQPVGSTSVTGTITVGNAAANAVPVQVTNQASEGAPWQRDGSVVLAPGELAGARHLATVPDDKRLVVEFVSARTPPTDAISTVAVFVGGEEIFLPMQRYNAVSPGVVAVPVRAYADAGEAIELFARDNSGDSTRTSTFTVVGRLVDAP